MKPCRDCKHTAAEITAEAGGAAWEAAVEVLRDHGLEFAPNARSLAEVLRQLADDADAWAANASGRAVEAQSSTVFPFPSPGTDRPRGAA